MSNDRVSSYQVLSRLAGCALPDRSQLEHASMQQPYRPGEPLFVAGERRPFVYVVNEGIVKMVYETPNGDAWIKGFADAGMCFASLTALEENGRASYSAYAEVESTVTQIDYCTLQRLADRHPEWLRVMASAFKVYGQRKEQREMELLTLSAEDRYLSFIRQYDAICARIRQRDIASYVRVTPVALSRIKSRLKAKGILK